MISIKSGSKMYLGKMKRLAAQAASRGLPKCGELVKVDAKALVGTTGRHAAAPGSPPHKRTGRLQRSIQTEAERQHVLVGPTVSYGKDLEFGTRRAAARPFMRPALRHTQRRFANKFKGTFR